MYQIIGELLIQPDNEVSGKLQLLSLGIFGASLFYESQSKLTIKTFFFIELDEQFIFHNVIMH